MTKGRILLFLAHFTGNALLLYLVYYWLGLDESDGSHLSASFGLALVIAAGAVCLHGWALSYFSGLSAGDAAKRSLRVLPQLLLLSIFAISLYWIFAYVPGYYAKPAFVIGSFLTFHLRVPVSPLYIERAFHVLLLVVEWALAPALLLQFAVSISMQGWQGFRFIPAFRARFWLYGAIVGALLLCAIWIPLKLFFWIPSFSTFGGELTSFLLRNAFGYLLFVTSLLALEFITAAGKPFASQPKTSLLP